MAAPCKTITYAIGRSADGDIVEVLAGTYNAALGESIPILVEKDVKIWGAGAGHTVVAETGFTVSGANVEVRRLTVLDGRGITFEDGSTGTVDACEMTRNLGDGVTCRNSRLDITNSVFRANGWSGIYLYACDGSVTNNTVVGNGVRQTDRGGLLLAMSDPVVANNIVVSNLGYGIESNWYDAANHHNDIWNNAAGDYAGVTAGAGSISVDPRFRRYPDDLALSCDPIPSPCINAGSNDAAGKGTADHLGYPRLVGDVIDMGAYEAVCTRYASADGVDAGSCLLDAPCATVSYAVRQARAGDTVFVGPGVFTVSRGEVFPIVIRSAIRLTGSGADATVLSAAGSEKTALEIDGVDASVTRLRITGGLHGIEVSNGSKATIHYNEVSGNALHGIHVVRAEPWISSNLIVGNGWSGIGNDWSNPVVTNNTIGNNGFHGIHNANGSLRPTIYNNLLAYHNQCAIRSEEPLGVPPDYNLMWGNIQVTDCGTSYTQFSWTADPRFLAADDYHLACGSAGIDRGQNYAPGLPPFDLDGNPRIAHGTVDVGAYEVQSACTVITFPFAER